MSIDDKPQLSMQEAEMALAAYLAPWIEGRVRWEWPGAGEGLAYLERAARGVQRADAKASTDWWVARVAAGEVDSAAIASALRGTRSVAVVADAADIPALRELCDARFAHLRVLGLTAWRAAGLVELGATPEGVAFDDSLAGAPDPFAMLLLAGDDLSVLDPYVVVALPLPARSASPAEAPRDDLDSLDVDVVRLEQRLREVGRQGQEAARERDRIAGLLRDLTSSLRSNPSVPDASGTALDAGAPDFARRAAAAEASREEARHEASELHHALQRARRQLESSQSRCASLDGRSRGLAARLAEVEEMREMVEARLALAQDDVVRAEGEELRLERSLAEANEAVEMAVVREHGAPGLGEHRLDLGRQVAALEARLEVAEDQREHARGENLRLLALVGSMEHAAAGMRAGHRLRVAELAADAEHHQQSQSLRHQLALSALRAEVAGASAQLADREASRVDREAASAEIEDLRQRLNVALDEADAMRAEVLELRMVHQELTLRVAELDASVESRGARAADLASSVAARDALVERLQLDLVEEEQLSRRREESRQRAEAECARLRDALLRASEVRSATSSYPPARIDEYEQTQMELERQLAELRHGASTERDSAATERVRADEAAARCASIEGALGAERQRVSELSAELEGLRGAASGSRAALLEARQLLANLAHVAAPSTRAPSEITAVGSSAPTADDETLIRSLTAQLEERNERIRNFETRLATADRTGERLALEETVAKLRSDLATERAARVAVEARAGDERVRVELDTLRQTLRDRYADMLRARSEVEGAEAQASALRGALAETRGGLEALLGEATASGDTATADRVGALLRLLGRF